MNEAEIKRVVQEVLIAERQHLAANQDTMVLKTISTILTSFGLEEDERKEIKADFLYIRRFRKASEQAGRVGIGTIIAVVVSGLAGALWLGFKALLGK